MMDPNETLLDRADKAGYMSYERPPYRIQCARCRRLEMQVWINDSMKPPLLCDGCMEAELDAKDALQVLSDLVASDPTAGQRRTEPVPQRAVWLGGDGAVVQTWKDGPKNAPPLVDVRRDLEATTTEVPTAPVVAAPTRCACLGCDVASHINDERGPGGPCLNTSDEGRFVDSVCSPCDREHQRRADADPSPAETRVGNRIVGEPTCRTCGAEFAYSARARGFLRCLDCAGYREPPVLNAASQALAAGIRAHERARIPDVFEVRGWHNRPGFQA